METASTLKCASALEVSIQSAEGESKSVGSMTVASKIARDFAKCCAIRV